MQFTLGFDPAHDLAHARAQVAEDDLGKWDETVPRASLGMQGGRLILPETWPADWPHALRLTPWATSQLCQRLGIPAAYFRKCPPCLQDRQATHWLQEPSQDRASGPETWLLRNKLDTLREVLSQRYARMDNALLLDALAPVLDEQFQVADFSLTEDSLHLRVISPHHARDIRPNDRLLVGLHLANSEVGARAVTLDALVFRLVCANGLVRLVKGKSLLYRRHIGLSDPAAFRQQLGQAISRALICGVGFLDQLLWTANTYLPRMVETIAALGEQWNLSQTMQERITANLLAEPGRDQELLWSLINAITLAAQSLPPDDRYDLEVKAALLAEEGFLKLGSAKSRSNARHRLPQIGVPEPGPMSGFPNGSGLVDSLRSLAPSGLPGFNFPEEEEARDHYEAGPVLGRA